jgi:hypothetical protein
MTIRLSITHCESQGKMARLTLHDAGGQVRDITIAPGETREVVLHDERRVELTEFVVAQEPTPAEAAKAGKGKGAKTGKADGADAAS